MKRWIATLKRRAIERLDWLDDLAGHPSLTLCNTITQSKWWGEPDFRCGVCGFESWMATDDELTRCCCEMADSEVWEQG